MQSGTEAKGLLCPQGYSIPLLVPHSKGGFGVQPGCGLRQQSYLPAFAGPLTYHRNPWLCTVLKELSWDPPHHGHSENQVTKFRLSPLFPGGGLTTTGPFQHLLCTLVPRLRKKHREFKLSRMLLLASIALTDLLGPAFF